MIFVGEQLKGYKLDFNKENKLTKVELPNVKPNNWISIKTRKLTKEEKEEYNEISSYDFDETYDCPLPDDQQEVLVTTCCGDVTVDIFCRDGVECYFENYCDDGDVIAWQPKPEPYR